MQLRVEKKPQTFHKTTMPVSEIYFCWTVLLTEVPLAVHTVMCCHILTCLKRKTNNQTHISMADIHEGKVMSLEIVSSNPM